MKSKHGLIKLTKKEKTRAQAQISLSLEAKRRSSKRWVRCSPWCRLPPGGEAGCRRNQVSLNSREITRKSFSTSMKVYFVAEKSENLFLLHIACLFPQFLPSVWLLLTGRISTRWQCCETSKINYSSWSKYKKSPGPWRIDESWDDMSRKNELKEKCWS